MIKKKVEQPKSSHLTLTNSSGLEERAFTSLSVGDSLHYILFSQDVVTCDTDLSFPQKLIHCLLCFSSLSDLIMKIDALVSSLPNHASRYDVTFLKENHR